MPRVQVVLDDEQRDELRRAARLEGESLSAFLREAGLARAAEARGAERFRDRRELEEFFDACDRRGDGGREPEWEEHRRVIEASRSAGLPADR